MADGRAIVYTTAGTKTAAHGGGGAPTGCGTVSLTRGCVGTMKTPRQYDHDKQSSSGAIRAVE